MFNGFHPLKTLLSTEDFSIEEFTLLKIVLYTEDILTRASACTNSQTVFIISEGQFRSISYGVDLNFEEGNKCCIFENLLISEHRFLLCGRLLVTCSWRSNRGSSTF